LVCAGANRRVHGQACFACWCSGFASQPIDRERDPISKFLSDSDFDHERAVTALIVCPSVEDAVEALKNQGITTTVAKLEVMRDKVPSFMERYQERRQELAPILEGILANDLLDNARRSTVAVNLAVQKTQELLEAGKVQDPSRVARDLSQVMSQQVEKRMSIQGRPTQIVEHRDVNQILAGLQALGVVKVDAIESTADEGGADGGDEWRAGREDRGASAGTGP
jgi:hypothetical protein